VFVSDEPCRIVTDSLVRVARTCSVRDAVNQVRWRQFRGQFECLRLL